MKKANITKVRRNNADSISDMRRLLDIELSYVDLSKRIERLESAISEISVQTPPRRPILRRITRSIRLQLQKTSAGSKIVDLYAYWVDATGGNSRTNHTALLNFGNSDDVPIALADLASTRQHILLSRSHVSARKRSRDIEMPCVTISMVLYNSEQWLPDFLPSILELRYPLDKIDLIFVDNDSVDKTVSIVEKWISEHGTIFHEVHIIRRPNNGFGSGNNAAIRIAKTEFILVTNVDGKLTPDTINELINVAISDDDDISCWEARQSPFEHPKYYDPVTLLTNWSSHACILIRKSAYEAVGGYDESIFMYGEDVELSYRFRAHGFRLRYVPSAIFVHHTDVDVGRFRPHQMSGSLAANVLLRYRYGSKSDAEAGEIALKAQKGKETDLRRILAFEHAIELVRQNRSRFRKSERRKSVHFPFSGFDYEIRRDGADYRNSVDLGLDASSAPKVSIITRTIAGRQWLLREAITSVLNQTYSNIEHIIVQDGGSDAEELVAEVRATYGADIRFIQSPIGGRTSAGNAGLRNARGQYALFLDDDDLLFADHVELLAGNLRRSPQFIAAYSLAWEVKTDINHEKQSYEEITHQLLPSSRRPFDRANLLYENIASIQSVLFRLDAFRQCGGFHEDMDVLEDWNLWCRYAYLGDFKFIEKLTSMYRVPVSQDVIEKRQNALDKAYVETKERNIADITSMRKKIS